MFKWLKNWLSGFFDFDSPFDDLIDVQPEIKQPKKRAKKKKIKKRHDISGFKKKIDYYYDLLSHKDYMENGCSVNTGIDTVKALRAIGLFTVHDISENEAWIDATRYEWVENGLPMTIFVSMEKEETAEERSNFLYAFHLDKKKYRHMVEWCGKDEELYELGYGLYDKDPPRWFRRSKGKIIWVFYYHAINKKTGVSRLLKHRLETRVNVGRHHYTQVKMVSPNNNIQPGETKIEDGTLAGLMNIWAQIDNHWQVHAKRGDVKITACIPQNEAKHYFRKRNIVDGGKRKPIMHWVKAHERVTKTKIANVKTHIRGNRKFTWGDYDVTIRVPAKHGGMLSNLNLEVVTPDFDDGLENTIPVAAAMKIFTSDFDDDVSALIDKAKQHKQISNN